MKIFIATLFILICIAIFFCVSQFKSEVQNDDTLNLIFGAEPEGLDPAVISGIVELRYVDALFEGLLSYDPQTLNPVPAVAESYEISEDGKIYKFHIRTKPERPRWSNGSPVTAHDFEYSFFRVLNPKTASKYVSLFFLIKNAREYYKGKLPREKVGIKAINDLTLEITLSEPCPYFPDLVAFMTFFPVHKETVEKFGNDWIKPGNIVSNGAFILKEWKYNNFLRFAKNPFYWNKDKVRLKEINAYAVENSFTALNMYESGLVDLITTIPSGHIDKLKSRKDFHSSPALMTTFLRFNVTREPFDNPDVRKAFGISIDREAIVKYITRGGEVATSSFTPPNIQGYTPPDGVKTDFNIARRLLYKSNFSKKKIEFLIPSNELVRKIAEMIQSVWKKELNVHVEILSQEKKIWLESMRNLDYDVCYSNWIGDYNDPSTFIEIMVSESPNNRTGWKNPDYDNLVFSTSKEKDNFKRWELYKKAEKILIEDEYPIAPLFHNVNIVMYKDFVKGVYPNPRSIYPLKNIFLEK